jgi:hypothetical protein
MGIFKEVEEYGIHSRIRFAVDIDTHTQSMYKLQRNIPFCIHDIEASFASRDKMTKHQNLPSGS